MGKNRSGVWGCTGSPSCCQLDLYRGKVMVPVVLPPRGTACFWFVFFSWRQVEIQLNGCYLEGGMRLVVVARGQWGTRPARGCAAASPVPEDPSLAICMPWGEVGKGDLVLWCSCRLGGLGGISQLLCRTWPWHLNTSLGKEEIWDRCCGGCC